MKTKFPFLLFFIVFNSFAQISLEHSYTNSAVTRIKLEYSGEKYYELKRETNEVIFYNSDHTLWKTIVLPASTPNPLATPTTIYHVSEAKLNPDANLEIIFGFYSQTSFSYEYKIISENGITLLSLPNATSVKLNAISGLPNKLIATGTAGTKVYSIPELVLENTYNYGNLKRIKLENSGEKYYLLDKTNKVVNIYNPNHSLWKTVSLPKPTNATYTDIDFISETKINPDALIEIGYSISETANKSTSYSSKILNENNVVLLDVPTSRKLILNSIDGLADKLVAEIPIDYSNYSTNIYSLPSLNLEKSYASAVSRVKLENSGEKYFTSYKPLGNQVQIYNNNHTLWKTVTLSTNSAILSDHITTVSSISESKINSDALIELVYTYETGLLGIGYEYSSAIINENGEILLDAEGIGTLIINEISGLQNKIIGANYNPLYGDSGFVYALNNLSTSDFNKIDKVIMYPIPAKSFININSISAPIKEAAIYNTNGIVVKKENAQNITKIDVEKLPTGIYIVNLTDFNNQKSTHKITVLHQ